MVLTKMKETAPPDVETPGGRGSGLNTVASTPCCTLVLEHGENTVAGTWTANTSCKRRAADVLICSDTKGIELIRSCGVTPPERSHSRYSRCLCMTTRKVQLLACRRQQISEAVKTFAKGETQLEHCRCGEGLAGTGTDRARRHSLCRELRDAETVS